MAEESDRRCSTPVWERPPRNQLRARRARFAVAKAVSRMPTNISSRNWRARGGAVRVAAEVEVTL